MWPVTLEYRFLCSDRKSGLLDIPIELAKPHREDLTQVRTQKMADQVRMVELYTSKKKFVYSLDF